MITPEDNDRILRKAKCIQFFCYLSDLSVHISHTRIIGMPCLPMKFFQLLALTG